MKISIALCTYNGVDFIEEQLQSIIKQTVLPYEVVICDDGSTDGTIQVIEEFIATSPVSIKLYKNHVTLGVVKNFEQAIGYCSGDYIALSDQDDVWIEEKLEISIKKLMEIERGRNVPVLVHTDLVVVDENLNVIAPSLMRYQGIHHEDVSEQAKRVLLFQNFVTGCTILFNRNLKEKVIPFPQDIVMHDWWLALASSFWGIIGYINQPTVLYRQHANNQVGAKNNGWKEWMYKITAWGKLKKSVHDTVVQSLNVPSAGNKSTSWIHQYKDAIHKGDLMRIWALGIHKQNQIKNLIFYLILWIDCKNESKF